MNDTTRNTNTSWTPDQEEEEWRREVAHGVGGCDDMLLGVNRVTSSRAEISEPGTRSRLQAGEESAHSGNLSNREARGPDSAQRFSGPCGGSRQTERSRASGCRRSESSFCEPLCSGARLAEAGISGREKGKDGKWTRKRGLPPRTPDGAQDCPGSFERAVKTSKVRRSGGMEEVASMEGVAKRKLSVIQRKLL
ncbi:hypothetical protein MRX96_000389 [Rhipicephalus microplus]